MGKHSGPPTRRGPRRAPGRSRRLPWSALLLSLLSMLAWAVLVWFAIQLGPDIRGGKPSAWAVLLAATLGAMACLFLGLVQGMKLLEALRTTPRVRAPVRPVGGRRAKR